MKSVGTVRVLPVPHSRDGEQPRFCKGHHWSAGAGRHRGVLAVPAKGWRVAVPVLR